MTLRETEELDENGKSIVIGEYLVFEERVKRMRGVGDIVEIYYDNVRYVVCKEDLPGLEIVSKDELGEREAVRYDKSNKELALLLANLAYGTDYIQWDETQNFFIEGVLYQDPNFESFETVLKRRREFAINEAGLSNEEEQLMPSDLSSQEYRKYIAEHYTVVDRMAVGAQLPSDV